MKKLADGVWQLGGLPPNAINVFVVGDVLVDTGTKFSFRRIKRETKTKRINAIALTHGHADHQGSAKALVDEWDVPLWAPAKEAAAIESGDILSIMKDHPMAKFVAKTWAGPGCHVARTLREGDDVADFKVIETPGHTPGHISLWRESDRTLIVGDVVTNMNLNTGIPGLHDAPPYGTVDLRTCHTSADRLAELEPELICFGHGPPLRDTKAFVDFVRSLSDVREVHV